MFYPTAPESRNAAPARTGSGVWRRTCLCARLLRDVVAALPGGVLRGLDLLPALAPQNADETPHRVLLPARCFDDFSERHTLGTLHHRDHLCFFVGSRFTCALRRRCAPGSLGRGLLRLSLGGRGVGRLFRGVRGETRDRLTDPRNGRLAIGELLDRLQVVEWGNTREAIPGLYQTGRGPFRGELREFFRR